MTFHDQFRAGGGVDAPRHEHDGAEVSGDMPFVAEVDGVTIAAHAARHVAGGADPISLTDVGFPTGAILMWPTAVAPTGWLLMDGSVVSQTTYADLYALIGSTFDTGGEGAGNFRLPNMQDLFPVGAGFNYAVGDLGGSPQITLAVADLPAHDHSIAAHSHGLTGGVSSGSHTHGDTFGTGNQSASHSHNSGTLVVDAFFSSPADASVGGAAERMRTSPATQGANVGGSTGIQSASHTHAITGSVSSSSHTHGNTFAVASATINGGLTGSTGTGAVIENRPPYMGLTFIIKT